MPSTVRPSVFQSAEDNGAGAGIGRSIARVFAQAGASVVVSDLKSETAKTDAMKSVLTPDIEKSMLKHTPLERLGEPEDIAHAALFLCSPAASWISGSATHRVRRRRSGALLILLTAIRYREASTRPGGKAAEQRRDSLESGAGEERGRQTRTKVRAAIGDDVR